MKERILRARIYLNGKRITKKTARELFGKEKVEKRIEEANTSFINDPYEEISWMDGMEIRFVFK